MCGVIRHRTQSIFLKEVEKISHSKERKFWKFYCFLHPCKILKSKPIQKWVQWVCCDHMKTSNSFLFCFMAERERESAKKVLLLSNHRKTLKMHPSHSHSTCNDVTAMVGCTMLYLIVPTARISNFRFVCFYITNKKNKKKISEWHWEKEAVTVWVKTHEKIHLGLRSILIPDMMGFRMKSSHEGTTFWLGGASGEWRKQTK